MIDGGNEYAQNNKEDPYRCIDHIKILKKTKLTDGHTKNAEHETK